MNINVFDSTTTSESIVIVSAFIPFVTDATTTSENITIVSAFIPFVTDSTVTSEYVNIIAYVPFFDIHSLFAYSTVNTIVSQANNVLILTVQSGDGAKFSVNQQVTIWPIAALPLLSNAMVCRVTAISGNQITLDYSVGNREGSNVRNVINGDQIANTITPKVLTDIEWASRGGSTLVVAASNASVLSKDRADYVCTGVNDDQTIMSVINSFPATGGKVILTEGTYTLGASITIAKNDITIEGKGKSTKIKLGNALNVPLISMGDPSIQYYRTTIKGIYFDGNQANQSSQFYMIDNYVASNPVGEVLITDCYFVNSYSAAIATQVFGSGSGFPGTTISNCIFENWKGVTSFTSDALLILSDYPNGSIVKGCSFNASSTKGLILYDANVNSVFVGNYIILPSGFNDTVCQAINIFQANTINVTSPGSSFVGLNFVKVAVGNYLTTLTNATDNAAVWIKTGADDCVIANNNFSGGGVGVDCGGGNGFSGVNISGNVFADITTNAIKLGASSNATNCSITNNTFDSCAKAANNTYDVILFIGNSAHNIVTGNNFFSGASNKPRYNINENSSGTSNLFADNIALNGATGQINVTSGSSVNVNNITT